MASLNFATKEILCKIVYYGPGLCGKTTNLQFIHARVPEKYRGRLISIDTQKDRTLFFDLLPLDYGKFRGFDVRLQLYTVPGQVFYDASRRVVLKGADGVVFVADSLADRLAENVESFKNLAVNLAANNLDYRQIPKVLQFNKRDLNSITPVETLIKALNGRQMLYFESVATQGKGVFETLKGISNLVVKDIRDRYSVAFQDLQTVTKPSAGKAPVTAPVDKPIGKEQPRRTEIPAKPVVREAINRIEKPMPAVHQEVEQEPVPAESVSEQPDSREVASPRKNPLMRILSALFKWARKR